MLEGMRVVEGSAFVAAPLGGMTLAQMGADVIRFDAIGGGIDYQRWPVTPDGTSLFWAGMNKGKRSLAVDVRSPQGQEIVTELICGGGSDGGIFLSNFPATGWLTDARLRERRADLIYVNIIGNPDESTAVDYTVNPASGFAYATGPVGSSNPVNHVLPAWDIATGLTAATSLLASERVRSRTGAGGLVTISLADVAFAMVANLGYVAQAQVLREGRPPIGNDMYGAFGRDFATEDGRRVMVVAISLRQWQALTRATEIEPHLPAIEQALGLDFRAEGDRFRGRDAVAALIAPWVARHTLDDVREVFEQQRRLLGPVPDVHPTGRRGLAVQRAEPDVQRHRPARHRRPPSARHPRLVHRLRPCRPAPRTAARRAHRRDPRARSRSQRRTRSPSSTTPGSSRDRR